MLKKVLTVAKAVALFLCVVAWQQFASAATYVSFDVPGAVTIVPTSVNNNGFIAGYYTDSQRVQHGFLRTANGTVITFDVPASSSTVPTSINIAGKVTGTFTNGGGTHGFLRNAIGQYSLLIAPDANNATLPSTINDAGQISGIDGNEQDQGFAQAFVRDVLGNYTEFNVSGAIQTESAVMNQSGVTYGVAEFYNTGLPTYTNYVRDASGEITTFQVLGSYLADITGANAMGETTGCYYPSSSSDNLDFVRDQNGNSTSFAIAGALASTIQSTLCQYMSPVGIDDNGNAVGFYQTSDTFIYRGFQRTPAGVITSFVEPSAGRAKKYQGTVPMAVSGDGKVAGYYIDSQNAQHGFLKLN
jgi:hypothetical protein